MQFYANFIEQAIDNGLAFSALLVIVTFKRICCWLGMLNSFLFQIRTSYVKFEFYSNFV